VRPPSARRAWRTSPLPARSGRGPRRRQHPSRSYRSDSSLHIPLPTAQRVHLDENVDDLDGQCMTASASCTGRFLASMPMMQTATYSRRQDDDVVLSRPPVPITPGSDSSGGTPPKWPRLRRPVPESRNVRIAARNVLIWFQLGSPWDASLRVWLSECLSHDQRRAGAGGQAGREVVIASAHWICTIHG
jgi:hypothetical protein